jgi:hypothetical protein
VPDLGAVGAAVAALVGFAVGKAGHVLLYRHARLPLFRPLILAAAAGLGGWGAAAFGSPFPLDWGLLLLGGGVGGALVVRLLLRTTLFHIDGAVKDGSVPEPPTG